MKAEGRRLKFEVELAAAPKWNSTFITLPSDVPSAFSLQPSGF
jgi:hypothetical protein